MKYFRIFIFLTAVLCYSAEFTNVTGKGIGISDNEATTFAKKDALEKAVGVFLSSESIVKNYVTISDNIISKSNGFIKNYSVTDRSVKTDGSIEIVITANITDVVDQIVKDEMALKFLLSEMNFPGFAVVIYSNDNVRDNFAESSVKKYLLGKGLKLKNPVVVENDLDTLKNQGIDYVLQGRTEYNFMSLEGMYNIKTMKSLQTIMYLELIDCSTKEIISTHTIEAKKAHISENTAKSITLGECGPQIASYIITQAVKLWSDKLLE